MGRKIHLGSQFLLGLNITVDVVKGTSHFMVDRKQRWGRDWHQGTTFQIRHIHSHLLPWRPCPLKFPEHPKIVVTSWGPGGQHMSLWGHSSYSDLNCYSELRTSVFCFYILPCPQLWGSADVFTTYSWNHTIHGVLWSASFTMWMSSVWFPLCCLTTCQLISFHYELIFWCLFTLNCTGDHLDYF